MSTAVVPRRADRDKQREIERRARKRRAANLDRLRTTVDALESAVVASQTLGDNDAVWDEFLDPDTVRMRQFLRLSLALTEELKRLERDNVKMTCLLREKQLSMRVIAGILQERETNDWDAKVERMRRQSQLYFRPWTLDECQAEIDVALKDLNAFQWSTDKQSSDTNFMGWRESRRVDPARGVFQFQFDKTFRGSDMMQAVKVGWKSYTNANYYREAIVGPRLRSTLHVLQRLGPDVVIVKVMQRFPMIHVDVHIVYLIWRIETDHGFLQCVRSLCCPELIKLSDGANEMWPRNSIWLDFESLGEDFTFRMGGSIAGRDVTYLNQWMMAVLGSVLRSERLATGRQLVSAEDIGTPCR